jgi:hypothetical protein
MLLRESLMYRPGLCKHISVADESCITTSHFNKLQNNVKSVQPCPVLVSTANVLNVVAKGVAFVHIHWVLGSNSDLETAYFN